MTIYNGPIEVNLQFKLLLWVSVSLLLILLNATSSPARNVTFSWTANPETVEGYRLYYKTGASGEPYNGTDILEGPSPVATGNVKTITLHDLSDTETYYFTLTAYLGADESNKTIEIALSPVSSVNPPNIKLIKEIK